MIDLDNYTLSEGQVLTISEDNGKKLQAVEILVGDKTKASMVIDEELNKLQFVVSDTDIEEVPALSCTMSKDTVKNLVIYLKRLYAVMESAE